MSEPLFIGLIVGATSLALIAVLAVVIIGVINKKKEEEAANHFQQPAKKLTRFPARLSIVELMNSHTVTAAATESAAAESGCQEDNNSESSASNVMEGCVECMNDDDRSRSTSSGRD